MAKCCFCGKDYDVEFFLFKWQGYVVFVNMFCLCGDSMKWLFFFIMGGSILKYYVNMRYVDIVYFIVLYIVEFVITC